MAPSPSAAVLIAQNSIKIEKLESGISGLSSRFDRHLEIYAQNGKELAALKTEVNLMREDTNAAIRDLQGNLKWGVRIIIGALILAVLAVLIPNIGHLSNFTT